MSADNLPKDETIGARWIATGDKLLQHAAIRIVDGLVVEVIFDGQTNADQDLGDVLVTPAWVNAHTHLEFSHLKQPVGQSGMPITDWIPLVIADRIENSAATLDSIQLGLSELAQTGTVAVGEIATQPWHRELCDAIQANGLVLTSFIERLGNQSEQNATKVAEAKDWLDFEAKETRWHGGLSPHAPYSTNFDLFSSLVQIANSDELPLAMHLAESPEELEFLATGTGPFVDLLQRLNAAPPKRQRPVLDFLQAMSQLAQGLIIHGNYLTGDEMDFIAKHDSLHVVYCPRTHSFFQHTAYPLDSLRQRGINVAVGTDSRASNPDLNLLCELKQLAAKHPNVPAAEVLKMGTANGAKALGIDGMLGSLSKGKLGRYLVFPTNDDAEPLEELFRGQQT